MSTPRLLPIIIVLGTILGACASFEDEDLVIDLRVLAMSASVPDQVVDFDIENPPDPAEILPQLDDSEMCAYVADPADDRRLRWSMTLCVLNNNERCSGDLPSVKLASGIIEDPDVFRPAPAMCGTIPADGNLLGIVLAALEADSLSGLGGVEYGVSFTVGPEHGDPALDLFAGKTVTIGPRIPDGRMANNNPSVTHFDASIEGAEPVPLSLGRCVDQTAPLVVEPGQQVRLTPVEAEGAREPYVVPTLDGEMRMFTESLTYQWMAGGGTVGSGSTGGPRDAFGNPAILYTEWRAPNRDRLTGPTDIPLWIVQRDERKGATFHEACLRVVP